MSIRSSLLAALLGLLALGGPSTGATMYYLPDGVLAQMATAIVVGRVAGLAPRLDPARQLVVTAALIEVDEYVKTPAGAPPRLEVLTVGGRAGGLATLQPGAPRFQPGEKVLMYLVPDRDSRYRVLAMARGKYHVERAPGGDAELVRLDLEGLTQIDPSTGREIPADLIPAATGKVYLDDLVVTLRRSLAGRR
ncbi:MAG: hypothetical protein HY815_04765 [Candidatus Riflebacteria bacterium]|nr:hypothetical protein [Candidatus Riflebacteria bacterium]